MKQRSIHTLIRLSQQLYGIEQSPLGIRSQDGGWHICFLGANTRSRMYFLEDDCVLWWNWYRDNVQQWNYASRSAALLYIENLLRDIPVRENL